MEKPPTRTCQYCGRSMLYLSAESHKENPFCQLCLQERMVNASKENNSKNWQAVGNYLVLKESEESQMGLTPEQKLVEVIKNLGEVKVTFAGAYEDGYYGEPDRWCLSIETKECGVVQNNPCQTLEEAIDAFLNTYKRRLKGKAQDFEGRQKSMVYEEKRINNLQHHVS